MSNPSELIVSSKTFNPADVSFAPAKTDTRGGKKVQLMLNGSPIVISVPYMFTWELTNELMKPAEECHMMRLLFSKMKKKIFPSFATS